MVSVGASGLIAAQLMWCGQPLSIKQSQQVLVSRHAIRLTSSLSPWPSLAEIHRQIQLKPGLFPYKRFELKPRLQSE